MNKIILFALLFPLFISCADDPSKKNEAETLTFSTKTMRVSDFEKCERSKCPEIEINYLQVSGKPKISKKINRALEKHHAKLFITTDEPVADSLKAAIQDFIGEFKQFKADYPESAAGYAINIKDSIAYHSDPLLVVKTNYYIFTGGAHGYGATNLLSFNTKNGDLLSPEDLFTDVAAFRNYAEVRFREKFEVPKNGPINATGFFFEDNTFALPNTMAILKDEVVLLYNPYEAASYAQGQLELHFPKKEVKKWLKYE